MLHVKDEVKVAFDIVARVAAAENPTADSRSGTEPCVT
jgi:hypothetical protein